MESYIRPGCIVLTIYLRQAEAVWEDVSFFLPKLLTCIHWRLFLLTYNNPNFHYLIILLQLCCDLTSSLNKLLDVSDDTFWRTGWVHIRVQHQMAFIFDGLLSCLSLFLGVKIT
jgi:hypothetical protein